MFISSFDQIEQLFTNQEPEGQFIEYKKEEYKVIKIQSSGNSLLAQKHKHEFLKDICAFLNSSEGTIIIGVEEDATTGAPLGNINSAGIQKSSLPPKYTETLESMILTGITPPVSLKIAQIENSKNNGHCFIVVNINLQSSPIFAVLKNESGNDVNELFIRRGRNVGAMNPEEIKIRMENYNKLKIKLDEIKDKYTKKLYEHYGKTPMLLLVAHPLSNNFSYDVLHSEEIENLLRGNNTWEDGHFKVSMHELNLFAQPTYEGRKIELSGMCLEVWEDGTIIFYSYLRRDNEIKIGRFMEEDGSKVQNEWYVINPSPIGEWIKNFYRLSLQFYKLTNFFGDVIFSSHLLGLDAKSFAYADVDNYQRHPSFSGNDSDYIPVANKDSHYGPKYSDRNEIVIENKVNPFDYDETNLEELDKLTKTSVLDYLWRAFHFEDFPNQ